MKKEFRCLNCGSNTILGGNYTRKYCSNSCQQEYQHKKSVEEWLRTGISPSNTKTSGTIKRWLMNKNPSCWNCGITEWNNNTIVFDVEHIDGNYMNNTPNNLELLCPNCHSQTKTYKNKNKGKGRHTRRNEYKLSKS